MCVSEEKTFARFVQLGQYKSSFHSFNLLKKKPTETGRKEKEVYVHILDNIIYIREPVILKNCSFFLV